MRRYFDIAAGTEIVAAHLRHSPPGSLELHAARSALIQLTARQ